MEDDDDDDDVVDDEEDGYATHMLNVKPSSTQFSSIQFSQTLQGSKLLCCHQHVMFLHRPNPVQIQQHSTSSTVNKTIVQCNCVL